MDRFVLNGGPRLKGKVRIDGAKNAALPIMAGALLSDGPNVLQGVPDLADVRFMGEVLGDVGARISRDPQGGLHILVEDEGDSHARYDRVRKMRASVCVLGPLLAKRKRARVSLPGGCQIGPRPIDLHLRGLKALGAEIELDSGDIVATCKRLRGAHIFLGGPFGSTVLGTDNVMMAAALAEGRTVIESAACEPEVEDLAEYLTAMGAHISGAGTPRITIDGVDKLHGAEHKIIPDRVEAGTFMIAAAITGGDVLLEKVSWEHMGATVETLRRIGVSVERELFGCRVTVPGGPDARLTAADIVTAPYPGPATDVQAPFSALLCLAAGQSRVTDTIFPDRFTHVDELNRLGANIRMLDAGRALIEGVDHLSGAPVHAPDLRACAALILAGLAAQGVTRIFDPEHIDRGYDRIEEKLTALGARIRRTET